MDASRVHEGDSAFFSPNGDRETERNLFSVDEQAELALARKPRQTGVSPEIARSQKSSGAALALAISAAGLEDKEVYLELKMNAGHWSEIKTGKKHFPMDKVAHFCQIVGNTIYPEWVAGQVGCYLKPLQTELERELENTRAELERERYRYQIAMEVMRGGKNEN